MATKQKAIRRILCNGMKWMVQNLSDTLIYVHVKTMIDIIVRNNLSWYCKDGNSNLRFIWFRIWQKILLVYFFKIFFFIFLEIFYRHFKICFCQILYSVLDGLSVFTSSSVRRQKKTFRIRTASEIFFSWSFS